MSYFDFTEYPRRPISVIGPYGGRHYLWQGYRGGDRGGDLADCADCSCMGEDLPADYVRKGDRIRWQAEVTTAFTMMLSVPVREITDALQAQGVYQIAITDNGSFLQHGGVGNFTLTIDASWPIDMGHIADVQSVINGAVQAAGLGVVNNQPTTFLSRSVGGGGGLVSPPSLPPGTPPPAGSGGGWLQDVADAIGLDTTTPLIIGGVAIVAAIVLPMVLRK